MAEKLARNNICGVLKISDGDTPENEIELQFDNGSLNITLGGEETYVRYDRGDIHGAVKGKDIPSDISFEADFVELYKESGDANPSLFEALYCIGGAAAIKASFNIGGSVNPGVVFYEAVLAGDAGNSITVFHQTGGAESISVLGNAITITLNTGTSTATTVVALIVGSPAASALVNATVDTVGIIDAEGAPISLVGGWDGWISTIDGDKYGIDFTWYITNPDATGETETITLTKCYAEPSGVSITENEDTDKITVKLKSLDNMPTVVRT